MRKIAVLRLFLPFLFAFIGLVLAFFAGCIVSDAGLLLWGCGISAGVHCMLVGSVLGSLFGCALAVPRGSASTGRRILSLVLAPAVAILVPHACFPLLDMIPPQYDRISVWILFLLVIPALSLLGFSIPVLLHVLKHARTHRSEGARK